MHVLVLATNYPSKQVPVALNYIHTRNLNYKECGIDVEVLNFATDTGYIWEGIPVWSLNEYLDKKPEFDILVSHAPNLRNHYKFLKHNQQAFSKIVFFFHGHEVLFRRKTYSKPYGFCKPGFVKQIRDDLYDIYKLKKWSNYLLKLQNKSYFVFVSGWMLTQFERWTGIKREQLKDNCMITYNGIGKNFENTVYKPKEKPDYDYITIRSVLDGSKYAIDIVCSLAESHPQKKFLIIGKGKFFDHYRKPDNLEWLNQYCDHQTIVHYLNNASCALMPTRTDAQGLMACEIASTGMPLITSDIDVCHEVFEGFSNVRFISNENPNEQFMTYSDELKSIPIKPNDKYYTANTARKEIELLNSLI